MLMITNTLNNISLKQKKEDFIHQEIDYHLKKIKEIIKSRKFFFAYVFFIEFCRMRNIYGRGYQVNEIIFMKSNVFDFFMEISDFIIKNKVINVKLFMKYILSKKIYFKEWNTQRVYEEYLNELFFIESPHDGVYRSINFIEKWCEKNNIELKCFFEKISENLIIHYINNKYLSPWFFFCSKKGFNFLMNIDDRKAEKIFSSYFNVDKWSIRLKIYKQEIEDLRCFIDGLGL